MRSTNTIVQHALEGAKVGGNVRHVTRTGKPKRKAANARRAVVLNVRPPSNPERNRGGRIVTAVAAALMLASANAHAERTDGADGERLETIPHVSYLANPVSPDRIDNRSQCGRVKRQITDGECCAYAVASYAEFLLWRKWGHPINFEPARIIAHIASTGNETGEGLKLPDCIRSLIELWSIGECKADFITKSSCADVRGRVRSYIHRNGAFPCTLHATDEWLEQYSTARPNIRPGFITGNGKRRAKHTVLLCGYDDFGVIFQNCWGSEWGEDGFGMIGWSALERDFICAAVITGCN